MTFSVLAIRDGHLGTATATCTLAVGAAVPALAPGVGGVVTQGWTNRRFRADGLEHLRHGLSAEEVVARLIASDESADLRQVAVLDAQGRVGAHSGANLTPWAGVIVDDGAVFIGNLLTGPEVVEAMAEAFRAFDGPLAARLAHTLAAGDAAGGDSRGRMSASLMVASMDEDDVSPPELAANLRIDDHADPVGALVSLERRWAARHN